MQRVLDSMHAHARVRAQRPPRHPRRQRPRPGPVTHRSTPTPVRPPNNARFVFLDPRANEFFRDWDKVANDTVALLRAEAGRDPYDRETSDLIGELSTRSDEFRRRWAAHDVRIHTTGVKLLHHPVVGDLDLPFESFPMGVDTSQSLLAYTPEPGSPSQDALNLLASWAASTGSGNDSGGHPDDQRAARRAGT